MNPNDVICNRCGKVFQMNAKDMKILTNGDYQVAYFRCHACKQPFQVLTTDTPMRELIGKRKRAETALAIAIRSKFREKTLKDMLKNINRIKSQQLSMAIRLKKIGDELLKDWVENG